MTDVGAIHLECFYYHHFSQIGCAVLLWPFVVILALLDQVTLVRYKSLLGTTHRIHFTGSVRVTFFVHVYEYTYCSSKTLLQYTHTLNLLRFHAPPLTASIYSHCFQLVNRNTVLTITVVAKILSASVHQDICNTHPWFPLDAEICLPAVNKSQGMNGYFFSTSVANRVCCWVVLP